MNKKIVILIPTFERENQLINLLTDIKRDSKEFDITIFITNDASETDYSQIISYLKDNFKFHYTRFRYNLAKHGFWQNINYLYNQLINIDFDYCFQLQDDFRLCNDFFNKAITTFESINDENIGCLNPLMLNELKHQVWVVDKLTDYNSDVYLSQWVDGCLISKRKYFESLEFKINSINSKNRISSGVGQQISKRITDKGLNIYMVKKTLIGHEHNESKMHKEHRQNRPLTAQI